MRYTRNLKIPLQNGKIKIGRRKYIAIVCKTKGCSTILSRYNTDGTDLCCACFARIAPQNANVAMWRITGDLKKDKHT